MSLKNEIQLELELKSFAQPAVDAAERADQAAAGAVAIATNAGNEAKGIANEAAALAQEASDNANAAATRVDEAIALAQRAAQHAQDTADSVNGAAARAETATATANTAADVANNAASRTQSAIENAQYATTSANNAASQASAAASNATAAMKTANNAASLANAAATSANHAAEDALAAAGAANNAANNANAAAKTAINMTTALENVHPQAVAATEAANAAAQNANTVAQNASAAVNKVVSDGNAAIESVKDVAADTLAAGEAVRSIYEVKADAIMDTSPKAASHEIHAQGGPLAVTLYGSTTETGSGDKSPDNPYTISGVNAAQVHAGGKNLFDISKIYSNHTVNGNAITISAGGYHCDLYCGGVGAGASVPLSALDRFPYLAPGQYILTYNIDTEGSSKSVFVRMVDDSGAVSTPIASGETDGTGNIFTIDHPTRITLRRGTNVAATISNLMITPGTEVVPYEPYTANVITPALLPDGSPLMGNGTVDDTIENDVLSEYDKKIVLTGIDTENWGANGKAFIYNSALDDVIYTPISATAPLYYMRTNYLAPITAEATYNGTHGLSLRTDKRLQICINGITTVADLRTYLAANPLTVYYRSTDYTPEKDLRVCKVTRWWTPMKTYDGNSTNVEFSAIENGLAQILIRESSVAKWTQIICDIAPRITTFTEPGVTTQYAGKIYLLINDASIVDTATAKAWIDTHRPSMTWALATPETYMTDPLALRKPTGIMPVTVTGSAETAVTYPHETKHYIDQKFDALAAALIGG